MQAIFSRCRKGGILQRADLISNTSGIAVKSWQSSEMSLVSSLERLDQQEGYVKSEHEFRLNGPLFQQLCLEGYESNYL